MPIAPISGTIQSDVDTLNAFAASLVDGTGGINVSAVQTAIIEYAYAYSTAQTLVWDNPTPIVWGLIAGSIAKLELIGATAILGTPVLGVAGSSATAILFVTQDGTGGRDLTFSASIDPGANYDAATFTSMTAWQTRIVTLTSDDDINWKASFSDIFG